jgi:regulator of PEP synthase PpsR (kinase-PPPase family)
MKPRRTVFFVSDRTGITAEVLGKTLFTQFPGVALRKHTLPFVDTREKAESALAEINAAAGNEPERPIVLSTLIDDELRTVIASSNAFCLDLFAGFIGRLETELGQPSSHAIGLTHGMGSLSVYEERMTALNYTLAHDDGITINNYADADVILIGVSRTGKTPTCLYLAMQYGVRAANYPLTPDDFASELLPKPVAPYRSKIFGLTISPERLSAIRSERKPGSRYASLDTCREEILAAEKLFRHIGIACLDTTAMSVEEIAITILHKTGLSSRVNI